VAVHAFDVKNHHGDVMRVVSHTFKVTENIDKYNSGIRAAPSGVKPGNMSCPESLFHVVYPILKIQHFLGYLGVFLFQRLNALSNGGNDQIKHLFALLQRFLERILSLWSWRN